MTDFHDGLMQFISISSLEAEDVEPPSEYFEYHTLELFLSDQNFFPSVLLVRDQLAIIYKFYLLIDQVLLRVTESLVLVMFLL